MTSSRYVCLEMYRHCILLFWRQWFLSLDITHSPGFEAITKEHVIPPDSRALSYNRHEVHCPPPLWLPNILFHGPGLLSYRHCAAKSGVVVTSCPVKEVGVWVLAKEQWGQVTLTGLPRQSRANFSGQIRNWGLNHRFKPYLEIRSCMNA